MRTLVAYILTISRSLNMCDYSKLIYKRLADVTFLLQKSIFRLQDFERQWSVLDNPKR